MRAAFVLGCFFLVAFFSAEGSQGKKCRKSYESRQRRLRKKEKEYRKKRAQQKLKEQQRKRKEEKALRDAKLAILKKKFSGKKKKRARKRPPSKENNGNVGIVGMRKLFDQEVANSEEMYGCVDWVLEGIHFNNEKEKSSVKKAVILHHRKDAPRILDGKLTFQEELTEIDRVRMQSMEGVLANRGEKVCRATAIWLRHTREHFRDPEVRRKIISGE